ncbi:fam-m protein [Plasmodium malariae]|uniref:Fam-m protein n=1 Tax=Plasmodium malariae TaxID=5858 RepID=A0A1D3JLE1_PLAMA|nr:fam-m protein [Plasmodium malariae]SBT87291.1 fam-m protein [Plasmodium malariae]
MEKIIRSLLFFKFTAFILLNWAYNFKNDLCNFNKCLDRKYNGDNKLDSKNYRLLAKYRPNKDSNIVISNDEMQNNGAYENLLISNNERGTKIKGKQSNRSSFNKAQYYTEVIDYNNGMFDGKHFHFAKKWVKKKDYDDFLEKNGRIGNIALKKIKFRNYGFVVVLFFLFFLLGIGHPVLEGLGYSKTVGEKIAKLLFADNMATKVQPYMCLILFSVLIVILSVIIIIAFYKILRNNEKYKRIKLMTE